MPIPQSRNIEGREWTLVPLVDGCDFESSRSLTADGSLGDCLNYEITSLGYERSQGLSLYSGRFDAPIENGYYVADTNANVTRTGTFNIGSTVEWRNADNTGGAGTLVFDASAGGKDELFITNISGATPEDSAVTRFTDSNTGATFTLTGSRRAQVLLEATDPITTDQIAATITDYLALLETYNTTVAQTTANTWPYYGPVIPGLGPISGGWQFQDTVYAVRDFYSIRFEAGQNEPNLNDVITMGTFTGTIAEIDLFGNTWENDNSVGFLYLKPADGMTFDKATYDLEHVNGTEIRNVTQGNLLIGTVDVDNTLASQQPDQFRGKGVIWKATEQGWTPIEMGYGIRFDTGTNAPNAQIPKLFNADSVASLQDTGWIDPRIVGQFDGTGFTAFDGTAALLQEDGIFNNCDVSPGGNSAALSFQYDNAIPAANTAVLGIEARIKCRAATGGAVRLDKVYLADQGAGIFQELNFESLNLTTDEYLTTGNTFYEFGGQTDLWGFDGKTVEDFNDGVIKLRCRFVNDSGATVNVEVDVAQIKVHYVSRGETLYFHNAASGLDEAQGELYSYNILDGNFTDNNAFGWMTFHDLDTPEIIRGGLELWTGELGTGTFIARVNSEIRPNLLPGWQELATAETRYQTLEANFYENVEGESLYGVTGVSPSFQFDIDEKFSYTRLPIDPGKDVPRHISFHSNHLVLAVGSHTLVSGPGTPDSFNVSEGGSSWSFRDPITGLSSTAGNTTAVFCRESIHALIGTSFDITDGDAYTQNVSADVGALEYTVADVMQPMYMDFNGVANIETTGRFGDFKTRPLTQGIYRWLRDRIQSQPATAIGSRKPVAAIPVRSKNQYRVFFNDGYILSLAVPVSSDMMGKPMIGHYDPANLSSDYVPTWVNSSVLSSGRERIVMGTKDGKVWIVDGANALVDESSVTELDCWFEINPLNGGYIQGATKYPQVSLQGDFYNAQNIWYTIGDSYRPPAGTEYFKDLGRYSLPPLLRERHGYVDLNTDTFTDGFSMRIRTTMDHSKPHTFHTMLANVRQKGANRNNTTVNRG